MLQLSFRRNFTKLKQFKILDKGLYDSGFKEEFGSSLFHEAGEVFLLGGEAIDLFVANMEM